MHWTLTGVAAGTALALSAGSLAWQVVSWRGTGPKIKLQITKPTEAELRQGFAGLVKVIIRNSGRSGTGVAPIRMAVVSRDLLGRRRREIGEAIMPAPQFRMQAVNYVDAHSGAPVYFSVTEILRDIRQSDSRYIRAYAVQGSGALRWSRSIEVLDKAGSLTPEFRGVTGGVNQ